MEWRTVGRRVVDHRIAFYAQYDHVIPHEQLAHIDWRGRAVGEAHPILVVQRGKARHAPDLEVVPGRVDHAKIKGVTTGIGPRRRNRLWPAAVGEKRKSIRTQRRLLKPASRRDGGESGSAPRHKQQNVGPALFSHRASPRRPPAHRAQASPHFTRPRAFAPAPSLERPRRPTRYGYTASRSGAATA
jgi:hypothetical protein